MIEMALYQISRTGGSFGGRAGFHSGVPATATPAAPPAQPARQERSRPNVYKAIASVFQALCDRHGVKVLDYDGLKVRRSSLVDGVIFDWRTADGRFNRLVIHEADLANDIASCADRLKEGIKASIMSGGTGLAEGAGELL